MVGVRCESVLPISGSTWRVEWREDTRGRDGMANPSAHWQATVTISINPPANDATILVNPAGLYVEFVRLGAAPVNQGSNRMKMAIGAALLAGLPALANAQQTAGTGNRASKRHSRRERHAPRHLPAVPAAPTRARRKPPHRRHQPPRHRRSTLLSPSAPLNAKEKQAVALARRWKSRAEMPQRGENGEVRFLYGATLPTVVCAPLQVCDLALQPGEIVNSVNVGDKVRWNISPGISGSAEGQHDAPHHQAGGRGSRLQPGDRDESPHLRDQAGVHAARMDAAGCIQYPDDMQRQWSAYQQTVAFGAAASRLPDR